MRYVDAQGYKELLSALLHALTRHDINGTPIVACGIDTLVETRARCWETLIKSAHNKSTNKTVVWGYSVAIGMRRGRRSLKRMI